MLRCFKTVCTVFVCSLAMVGVVSPAFGISGVCPDGSVFIVGHRSQIPCRGAKEVEPSDVPPLRPHQLPQPYAWEVYREQADVEGNPYHLIERAEQIRNGGLAPHEGSARPLAGAGQAPPPSTQVASQAASVPRADSVELGLDEGQLRDLFFLVELSQRDTPAYFVDETPAGAEALRLSFAYSDAFAARAQRVSLVEPAAGGAVLLFTAVAGEGGSFNPNFTFVQGHQAYRPDPDNARQLGLLRGQVGSLPPDHATLGYVVLPAHIDLAQPLDVYWDDRRIEARFLL